MLLFMGKQNVVFFVTFEFSHMENLVFSTFLILVSSIILITEIGVYYSKIVWAEMNV